MALYFATNNGLRSPEELERTSVRQTKKIDAGAEVERAAEDEVPVDQPVTGITEPGEGRIAFEAIGVGKPLTVEIRRVYTGRYPEPSWLPGRRPDMLVTSALKGLSEKDAAARAVNFLRPKVAPATLLRNPAATDQGTPLVHYAPALASETMFLTVEISFNKLDSDVFGAIAQALSSAAGVPVLAAASGYLLTAGLATKIAGDVADRIFTAAPVFRGTQQITFNRPGEQASAANFGVLFDDTLPGQLGEDLNETYEPNEEGELVHRQTGEPYRGPQPYVVISLDGRKNPAYEDFAPLMASAELLDTFFGEKEADQQPLQPLVDALTLYSDWTFRTKAQAARKELAAAKKAKDQKRTAEAQATLDAYLANIRHEELRP